MCILLKRLWVIAAMCLLLPTFSAAGTIELPKTGLTLCYDDVGTLIDCAGTGQDGEVQAGAAWPSPRFTDNGDGTITDNLTGLVWLQNAYCLGSPTWNDAPAVAAALADGDAECGLTDGSAPGDWRVPSAVEFRTLDNGDESSDGTWLAAQGFTNIRTNTDYWTDTVTTANSFGAWTYFPSNGNFFNYKNRGNSYSLWAVRGGAVDGNPDPSYPANTWKTGRSGSVGVTWPSPRFTDNGDGSITDNLTGVTWLQDAGCLPAATWTDAMTAVASLASGTCGLTDGSVAGDWRLPNYAELFSLIDFSRRLPALPIGHPFVNVLETPSPFYWSSTSVFGAGAKVVDLRLDGEVATGDKDGATYYSLPVRNFAAVVLPAPDITPSATTIPFGDVTEGTSADQILTLTNDGTGDLTIGAITQPAAPFELLNDTCSGQTRAPTTSCTVTVRFSPATAGAFGSSFDIPSNDPDENPVTVSLSGTGVSAAVPDITVSLTTVAFGDVTEGTSADQIVTITNDGTGDLTIGAITQPAAPFELLNDTCSGQTRAPTTSCTVTVRFSPTTAGVSSGSFDIPSDDPDENPVTVNLSGTGVAAAVPDITPSTTTIAFGDVTEGTSADRGLTLTNDGTAVLTIGAITAPPAPFIVVDDPCSGQPLTPAASCTLTVRFAPTAVGAASGSFQIPSDDPDENPVTISLNGTGTATPVPNIAVSAATIPFGQITEGTSADQVLTVSNTGNADLHLGQAAVADALAGPFSVAADNCSGQLLAPTESCTVTVRFAPTAVGSASDTFDIPSDDPDTATVTVSVNGAGTAVPVPDIAVTDTLVPNSDLQMPFPDTTVGASSATGTVTLANAGNEALNVSAIQLAGADAGEFALDVNGGASPCADTTPTLAAGESCTVSLAFTPATVGQKAATLEITSDDPDESSVTVSLSGNGLAVGPGANNPPTQPQLLFPADGQTVAISGLLPLRLRWAPATDPDGDPVSYQVYYCTDSDPFANCVPTQVAHVPPVGPGLPLSRGDFRGHGFPVAWLGAAVLAILFVMASMGGGRRRRLALCGIPLVAAGLLVAACGHDRGSNGLALEPANLAPNTTYHWGVVAEDDRGGATESEVWRFTTR